MWWALPLGPSALEAATYYKVRHTRSWLYALSGLGWSSKKMFLEFGHWLSKRTYRRRTRHELKDVWQSGGGWTDS